MVTQHARFLLISAPVFLVYSSIDLHEQLTSFHLEFLLVEQDLLPLGQSQLILLSITFMTMMICSHLSIYSCSPHSTWPFLRRTPVLLAQFYDEVPCNHNDQNFLRNSSSHTDVASGYAYLSDLSALPRRTGKLASLTPRARSRGVYLTVLRRKKWLRRI